MLEKVLWLWVSRARNLLTGLHMVRIENSISSGFPDVEGHYQDHGSFVLELKNCYRPARPTSQLKDLKVRPRQLDFLEDRASCGGNAYMCIRVSGYGDTIQYVIPGNSIEFLRPQHRIFCPITEERLRQFAVPQRFDDPAHLITFISTSGNMEKHRKFFQI